MHLNLKKMAQFYQFLSPCPSWPSVVTERYRKQFQFQASAKWVRSARQARRGRRIKNNGLSTYHRFFCIYSLMALLTRFALAFAPASGLIAITHLKNARLLCRLASQLDMEMAEKEICNTRLLNWTYRSQNLDISYEPLSIFFSRSLFSLCLSSSVAPALDRLPTVFVLQGSLAG